MINTIVEIEHKQDFPEQGFYSKSYLAIDKRLNREVAVKDIIYENLTSTDDFEKYFEEAYKLSMATHPRVLPVYYVGLDHNGGDEAIPRIVTCFYKNGSLNSYLEKVYATNKTLTLDEIIRYAHDIIQGMIHLHALDIVHLDLKASNIYIGDDFKMVIGDFGQAKFIKDGIIHEHVNLYPAIAPAEAAAKKALDKTTDIYQFGLLLYSMVCFNKYRDAIENTYKISTAQLKQIYRVKPDNVDDLKAEFKANMKLFTTAVKESKFPDRDSYPYYVPKKIQEIIHKCLEPVVANRYNNFYEIQADLNDFIFPHGVSELYQDLGTNKLHFTKEDKPCVISIEPAAGKYEISTTKNGRNVAKCTKSDVSEAKLQKVLFTFAEEI
ncbi:MAG: protein kinase [Verrucomicrobia bacterium]|nr:protein kinase [Verrucomicrobiota bacterium]